MTDDNLIEKAAKAIREAGGGMPFSWESLPEEHREHRRAQARAALAVFEEAHRKACTCRRALGSHAVNCPAFEVPEPSALLNAEGWPVPSVVDVVMKRWRNDNDTIRRDDGGWSWKGLAETAIQALAQAGLLAPSEPQGEPSFTEAVSSAPIPEGCPGIGPQGEPPTRRRKLPAPCSTKVGSRSTSTTRPTTGSAASMSWYAPLCVLLAGSPREERTMAEHSERVTITDALPWDCVEGECEHSDEADMNDFENCPRITIEVCVDCMEEREFGRDPRFWEELVSHTDPPMPDPVPEPPIFKPAPEVSR